MEDPDERKLKLDKEQKGKKCWETNEESKWYLMKETAGL